LLGPLIEEPNHLATVRVYVHHALLEDHLSIPALVVQSSQGSICLYSFNYINNNHVYRSVQLLLIEVGEGETHVDLLNTLRHQLLALHLNRTLLSILSDVHLLIYHTNGCLHHF
jgi:hypothetical protein